MSHRASTLATIAAMVMSVGAGYAQSDSESESVTKNRDGWKRRIRIGRVSDGVVTSLIPDPVEKIRGTSAAEEVAADAMGSIYGAEVGPRRVMKYVKK